MVLEFLGEVGTITVEPERTTVDQKDTTNIQVRFNPDQALRDQIALGEIKVKYDLWITDKDTGDFLDQPHQKQVLTADKLCWGV